MAFEVRLYQEGDFDQVVSIAVNALWQKLETARRVIRWASTDEKAKLFVGEVDGDVVGFLMLEGRLDWARLGEIGWIAVSEEHRRKGIGSALVGMMTEFAREKGLRKIYVNTSMEAGGALHFYIRNGFQPEGIMKDFYKDGEDGIILGKRIQ